MKRLLQCCLLILSVILSACAGTAVSGEIFFIRRELTSHEIVALNPANRQERVIIRLSNPGVFLADAGLSLDGKKVLYITNRDNSQEAWLTNSDGSKPMRVSLDFREEGFVWLDNNRIVFAGLKDEGYVSAEDAYQWKLYDLRSRELRPLIWKGLKISAPGHWSRSNYRVYIPRIPEESLVEEKVIVFYGHIEVENDVVRVVMDEQVDPAQLPRGLGSPGSATTDGRLIAFSGRGGVNNNDVFLASNYGRTVQQLTNFQKNYGVSGIGKLAISPNGRWVIFQLVLGLPRSPNLPTGGQDALVSTDGKVLKFLRGNQGGIYGNFVWSADSRYVAAGLVPQGADPNKASGEIHLIDVETGEVKQLTSDGWSKDVFDWR